MPLTFTHYVAAASLLTNMAVLLWTTRDSTAGGNVGGVASHGAVLGGSTAEPSSSLSQRGYTVFWPVFAATLAGALLVAARQSVVFARRSNSA